MKESKTSQKHYKIGIVITVGISLDLLYPDFYSFAQGEGFEVVGICAADRFVDNVRRQGVRVIEVPMTRSFTPFRDVVCLAKLYRIFRAERFDLIHYSTPKASVLAAIAGKLAGSARLLYTNRGLAYTGVQGVKRKIAKTCEIIASRCADRVIAVSPSLKEHAVEEGILEADKIVVYGSGSSKGVNLETFQCDTATLRRAADIRRRLNLADDAIVFGYAGRFTVEKGIVELLEAFDGLAEQYSNAHIVLVGEQDERMPLPAPIQQIIRDNDRVHILPYTDDMPAHLAAMDVFVIASYREGFPGVLIEAAAMERPVIASDIPGCRDAVKPDVTGLVVPARDSASLQTAMQTLIADSEKRRTMGRNGRAWVEAEFDRKKIWAWLLGVYQSLLKADSL